MFTANSLTILALAAGTSMASPMLFARQRGESPCFNFPDDRCPAASYCDSSIAPVNYGACRTLIDQTYQRSGNICAGGHKCQVWTDPNGGCRQGFCNSDDAEVCYSANQIAAWTEQGASDCEPSGFSLVPDIAPFVEVYLTAPLPQQKPDSRIASIGGITETTMSIDDFKAENNKIASAHDTAQKRQLPSDDDFTVTVFNFGTTRDGGSEQVSPVIQNTGNFNTQDSETYSFGVTASVGIEGSFFEVMSASAGVSVSSSTSYTNSKGIVVDVNCEGRCGIVEYFHLYDCYEGNFNPSGQPGSFCVPIDDGYYASRCIGCPV